MSSATTTSDAAERRAWLAAALVIALAYVPLTSELHWLMWDRLPVRWQESIGKSSSHCVAEIIFGLFLALSAPRASGLGFGRPTNNPKLVTALFLIPPILALIVIPLLPERPFAGMGIGTWLLSPLAQELVFTGFIYGRLERLCSHRIFPKLPMPNVVVVAAAVFSLSHVWNLTYEKMTVEYACFQLVYTFAGGLVHALLRHLTGSIWYGAVVHMTVNWIAVHA